MKNMKLICKTTLILAFIIIMISLAGCSNNTSSFGVPDSVVQDFIEQCAWNYFPEEYNNYTLEVFHNYNKETCVDAAIVNVEIHMNYGDETMYLPVWFTYNKAANIWTLTNAGSWSDPEYDINAQKLIGKWELGEKWDTLSEEKADDRYIIQIKSIDHDKVNLEYTLYTKACYFPDDLLWGEKTYENVTIKGSGTYEFTSWGIEIPITIPNGYDFQGSFKYEFEGRNTKMIINFDLQNGFNGGEYEGYIKTLD